MSKDYDVLIDTLTELCKKNGKATAKLGQDMVLMFSEKFLLSLLAAASADSEKRAIIVVIDSDNVKPTGLPN
jgi:hypothetical protein